jgi:RHS repeat-associated protein
VETSYSGNQTTVRDEANIRRQTFTDAIGRLTKVVEDPLYSAYWTLYTYDALDNLTDVNQNGLARHFVYDALKRLTSATNPENGTIGYVYDANGNLTSKTDARGVTVNYSPQEMPIDALNRVRKKTHSDGTPSVTFTYDSGTCSGTSYQKGRLNNVTSSVSSANYCYDPLGRVRTSSQAIETNTYSLSYNYNATGKVTSMIYPSGLTVATGYDSAGRPSAVTGTLAAATTPYAAGITYAPHGAMKRTNLGNGLVETIDYDPYRTQPTAIKLGTAASNNSMMEIDYGYCDNSQCTVQSGNYPNNNGNVRSQTIQPLGVTQAFSYDGLNRLYVASEGSNWTQTNVYTTYGNRAVVVGGYVPNSALTPQVITEQSPVPYTNNRWDGATHDAAGNVTAVNGTSWAFTYDGENLQASSSQTITGTTYTTNYSYDGEGRRVMKVASSGAKTIYVYDAMGKLAAEYSEVATSLPCTTCYLTADHLGSIRVVTDIIGNLISRHDYLPFGEEITTANRTTELGYATDNIALKFTGKERDAETGLDYFGARYFSAAQGRFTSPDEFTGGIVDPFTGQQVGQPGPLPYADITDPQTLNKYVYVRNNPLRYIDPDGHDFWDYVKGAVNAFTSDNTAGVGRIDGGNGDFQRGQAIGDAVATLQGAVETLAGAGGEIGGTALDLTGVGVLIGVPTQVVSAGAIVHGSATATVGFVHLVKAANAPGTTASGQATDAHGNKIGPSGKPQVNQVNHSTEKAAKDAARAEGKGAPVKHPSPTKEKPHYHPTDRKGEKIPCSTHHNCPS